MVLRRRSRRCSSGRAGPGRRTPRVPPSACVRADPAVHVAVQPLRVVPNPARSRREDRLPRPPRPGSTRRSAWRAGRARTRRARRPRAPRRAGSWRERPRPHRERALGELFLCAFDDVRPVRSAASSNDAIAIAIHSAFPQFGTLGEEMASRGVDRLPQGRGRTNSTAVFPIAPSGGLLSHFLVHPRASNTSRRSSATKPAWEGSAILREPPKAALPATTRKIAMSKRTYQPNTAPSRKHGSAYGCERGRARVDPGATACEGRTGCPRRYSTSADRVARTRPPARHFTENG